MNKFKAGNKIIVTNGGATYSMFEKKAKEMGADMDSWESCYAPEKGDSGSILNCDDKYCLIKINNHVVLIDENGLELVEERDLIVHCPTKELWNKVQEKMFEFTEWIYDGKEISNSWAEYGFNIIYSLKENNYKMLRGYKEYFNQTNYPDTPIISAEEYLGIEVAEVIDVPYDLPISNRCTEATLSSKNLQNAINYLTNQDSNKSLTKKTMSIVKSTFQSKESKAVAHFGLGENKNNLCRDGLWEFLQYLYETEADKKKDFLALLVKKQKEEKE